jgi:hypothetical protein
LIIKVFIFPASPEAEEARVVRVEAAEPDMLQVLRGFRVDCLARLAQVAGEQHNLFSQVYQALVATSLDRS